MTNQPSDTAAGVLAESVYDEAKREWTHKCGSTVMAAKVYHPVYFKEFAGPVGSGDVRIETVPYCPTCEAKPNENGAPIRV